MVDVLARFVDISGRRCCRTWRLLLYGAVFGALNLAQSLGTATGPLFSGMMHDATGSYVGAFTTAAVLLAIAIPTVLLVKKPVAPS